MSRHRAWARLSSLVLGLLTACGEEAPREAPAAPAFERPTERGRLAAGDGFSCFVAGDRSIQCWGRDPLTGVDVIRAPHRLRGFEATNEIIADGDALCTRSHDRRVVCVGPGFGPDEPRAPLELPALAGATSIAMRGRRVCGVVEGQLVCDSPNEPELHLPVGAAWLERVGDAVCVLDGAAPLRCSTPSGTLEPVPGTEGARDVGLARGACVVFADGTLRCSATASVRDPLTPVEGAAGVVAIAGGEHLRCISTAHETSCELDDEAGGPPRIELGDVHAVVIGGGGTAWHGCGLAGAEVRCFGIDRDGEAGAPFDESLVHRVEGVRDARSFALEPSAVVFADAAGALFRRPFHRTTATPIAMDEPVVEVLPCFAGVCVRTASGAYVVVGEGGRELSGLRGATQPFAYFRSLCGARDGDVVCEGLREPAVTLHGLTSAGSVFGRVCGLRGHAVRCALIREGAMAPEPLTDAAGVRVRRMFAGAEQMFLQLEDGTERVLGHNGTGQLGLRPSRPLDHPVDVPVRAFSAMTFAEHVSCGLSEGRVSCAGLDERLEPRVVGSHFGPVAIAPSDRGDGAWLVVPELHDPVSVRAEERGVCALEAGGELVCWGHHGIVWSYTSPRAILVE